MTTLTDLAATRNVLFVGGKGGVGKTSVASALGLQQARLGRDVLVVSTDPAHSLGHLWGCAVGDSAVELAPGLRGLEIDPARTTDEHLRAVGSTMERLMPEHLRGEIRRHLELAREAPGTHEAAVLERIAEVVEQRRPGELVVFDTAPSGHTARLMALPEIMQAWTSGLLRRQDRSAGFGAALRGLERQDAAADIVGSGSDPVSGSGSGDAGRSGRDGRGARELWRSGGDRRSRRDEEIRSILDRRQQRFTALRETLADARRTAFLAVLTAERLPVLETLELREQLRRAGVDVAALVVNRRSPSDAGELLAARHRQETEHLARLGRDLPDLPRVQIPLMGGDLLGAEGLEAMLRHL